MSAGRIMPSGIGKAAQDVGEVAEGRMDASKKPSHGEVSVIGFDGKDVLFRSDSANVVQIRNVDGEVIAMFIRLKGDVWGFSKRGDDDWDELLRMYGGEGRK